MGRRFLFQTPDFSGHTRSALLVASGMIIGCCILVRYLAERMKPLRQHIAPFLSALFTVLMLGALSMPAHAENDKRGTTSRVPTKSSTGGSYSPVNRAVSSALRTLTARRDGAEMRAQGKTAMGRDSSVAAPRIISTRVAAEVFTAKIEMATDEPLVDIAIFNMLGKRVMEVYKGASARGIHEHAQSVSDLPEGVYMCVMQGNNFRKAEKFFFSR
ncbi:MAG: T9SS type A sorting domain-containing protein [Candidatus Kapabacteria bacterium]|nr:T9SS type A sorting domain-containing protein [Candidatus Kapabacteria bacterium]